MSIKVGSGIIRDDLFLHLDTSSTLNYLLSTVEVLVVAGGGGGGVCYGGGGGGGGVVYNNAYPVTPGTSISVSIGNGGTNQVNVVGNGGPGANSSFGNLVATGGGYGGGNCGNAGGNGGSGGGGSGTGSARSAGGTGIPGQGNNGEHSILAGGGGGGGAGSNGYFRSGGNGLPFTINGSLHHYGGGGTGGGTGISPGGSGGGGMGGTAVAAGRADGRPNTGGGGGGSIISGSVGVSGVGGSGIVIVRYPGPQKATGGNTITQVRGYTVHTFTSGNSTFTPTPAPSTSSSVNGLYDLSENLNTFASSGGPTYSTSNTGSISFDGINDILLSPSVLISGSQTFSVWAVVTGGSNGLAGILVQHNYASTANFGINQTGLKLAPSIGYTNNTREYADKITNFTITNNVIFNAVLVYNSSENKIYWYINGQLDSSYTLTATPKFTNYPICLGRWDSGYGDYYFNGRVCLASIYNKALTATEITQNFNALRGRYGI